MMRSRDEQEQAESTILAPYAQSSAASRGRLHEEEPHLHRTEYQRDRDRIVHSRAFRRLEYKSQVFLNGSGDHYRTRLTHSIEVASIARSMARSLGLNESLAEAIALAHDLGHPPFGHPGESTLDRLMKEHGGFEHNQQSLRVVEDLELKYPEFNGINLTWEVLEGLAKPFSPNRIPTAANRRWADFPQPSLEAQVADAADEIAYVCHDVDDGLEAGLLQESDLNNLWLWSLVKEKALQPYPNIEPERGRSYVLRCMLDHLVEDAIGASTASLMKHHPGSADDARRHPEKLIVSSPRIAEGVREQRQFLLQNLYNHPAVSSVNQKACRCLEQLFELLIGHPHLLTPPFAVRIKKEGVHRATCNYLAAMTDRSALMLHQKLIGGENSLTDPDMQQPALL
ncbi:MAG: deoxyguanosinetriphosphate triphosphohydrolase [Verrucomicrobia bacterium Tous-C9LFEB]|nr:MAG: deoxyguanosinetriphosphate triphosphohydrolase [Verrucomicrobia bacterium Tous-C9LFEB]